ncbi:MAG: MBL fold metallo-hydrolase [Bacteroidia bacterium]|nr:MBL fold metallo-hydrolase [Bacteroidia bacterium]MCZ2276941.1 MBL fold metallo-hydrolase [Bacteroidia bacterium]
MKIEQIYTGCLAQGAYYITSGSEAVMIDPLRETQPYLDRLAKDKVKLKYIFETHFHADFVSGHIDLSKKTGALVIYGPTAVPEFQALIAHDNQVFDVGNISLKVIHTPGHTLESMCLLLLDENDKETALFSGDTLFLGDVGRPDLAQKALNMTQEQLAGMLYDSLYTRILPLSDQIVVYPAHGAGSVCGKKMMKETVDLLGNQKKVNYALNQPDKNSFITAVTDGLQPPPAYFGMNVAMNKKGYTSFEAVLNKALRALTIDEFEWIVENSDTLILDTRDDGDFTKGFIPQSVNISLNGEFAPWVGALIRDVEQPLILITEKGKERESVTRLSRVGFDHVLGYLEGGIETWKRTGRDTDCVNRITPEQFAGQVNISSDKIIDIRRESEFESAHVAEAYNYPLAAINDWIQTINPVEHFFLHCAGGYRSSMAASILQARGYRNFTEVAGGFNAISKTKVPVIYLECQNKNEMPGSIKK